jgi:hypothetical protein
MKMLCYIGNDSNFECWNEITDVALVKWENDCYKYEKQFRLEIIIFCVYRSPIENKQFCLVQTTLFNNPLKIGVKPLSFLNTIRHEHHSTKSKICKNWKKCLNHWVQRYKKSTFFIFHIIITRVSINDCRVKPAVEKNIIVPPS